VGPPGPFLLQTGEHASSLLYHAANVATAELSFSATGISRSAAFAANVDIEKLSTGKSSYWRDLRQIGDGKSLRIAIA
jgi:hypothetical protein